MREGIGSSAPRDAAKRAKTDPPAPLKFQRNSDSDPVAVVRSPPPTTTTTPPPPPSQPSLAADVAAALPDTPVLVHIPSKPQGGAWDTAQKAALILVTNRRNRRKIHWPSLAKEFAVLSGVRRTHSSLKSYFQEYIDTGDEKGKAAATAPTRVCASRSTKTVAAAAIAAAAKLDGRNASHAARPTAIATKIKTDDAIPTTVEAEAAPPATARDCLEPAKSSDQVGFVSVSLTTNDGTPTNCMWDDMIEVGDLTLFGKEPGTSDESCAGTVVVEPLDTENRRPASTDHDAVQVYPETGPSSDSATAAKSLVVEHQISPPTVVLDPPSICVVEPLPGVIGQNPDLEWSPNLEVHGCQPPDAPDGAAGTSTMSSNLAPAATWWPRPPAIASASATFQQDSSPFIRLVVPDNVFADPFLCSNRTMRSPASKSVRTPAPSPSPPSSLSQMSFGPMRSLPAPKQDPYLEKIEREIEAILARPCGYHKEMPPPRLPKPPVSVPVDANLNVQEVQDRAALQRLLRPLLEAKLSEIAATRKTAAAAAAAASTVTRKAKADTMKTATNTATAVTAAAATISKPAKSSQPLPEAIPGQDDVTEDELPAAWFHETVDAKETPYSVRALFLNLPRGR